MSQKVLVGDFLLELPMISPFLEFLIIPLPLPLTPRAEKQKGSPISCCPGMGRGFTGVFISLPYLGSPQNSPSPMRPFPLGVSQKGPCSGQEHELQTPQLQDCRPS